MTICPEGHSLRNGDRLLSRCYICATAELESSGATYFSDRGYQPAPHMIPDAERRRRFAQEQ